MGGLRYWLKLSLFFFTFVVFQASVVQAAEVLVSYKDILSKAFKESPDYQKISARLDSDNLDADSLLAAYNWNLSGGLSRTDAERPATNPFAPNGEDSSTYNLRFERTTASGLSPFVQVRLNDRGLFFPNQTSVDFQTASIETGLRLNLMKALLFKKSSKALLEASSRKEIAVLSMQNFKNDFALNVARAFFKALKTLKRFEILNVQCSEYSRLQKISSRRYAKRLIREKDYLTIEVLHQNCLLDKKTAENNKEMDKITLLKTAGLSLKTKLNLSKASFPKESLSKEPFDISQNTNYQLAVKVLEATEQKALALAAKTLPEINLDYSLQSEAGASGVGKSFAEAAEFDLLTHSIGLNFKYAFGGSVEALGAKKAAVEKRIKGLELENLKGSLNRDFETLSKTSRYLKNALLQSRSLVKLQDRKARLFRQDFANGKGGIRDLVEAQIAYLSSLEKALEIEYNKTSVALDLINLKGLSFEKFN